MPFTANAYAKHPFKRQLHTTYAVAVGCGQHGRSPTAWVWEGGSAFLPIGVPVKYKYKTKKARDTLERQPHLTTKVICFAYRLVSEVVRFQKCEYKII